MMKYHRHPFCLPAILYLILQLLTPPVHAIEEKILQLSSTDEGAADETELQIRVFGSHTPILIYFPAQSSPAKQNRQLTRALLQEGFQVWMVNPIEDRFLPDTASSYFQIPASDLSRIINAATRANSSPGNVYLLGSGRAAVPMLMGARIWQQQNPDKALGGAVFLSPYLYRETPDPGQKAQLLPIALNTNMPVYILQPELSPRYWQLRSTIDGLQRSGSDVFVRVLRQLRGRFEYRPDATDYEIRQAGHLAIYIRQAITALDFLPDVPRTQTKASLRQQKLADSKKERVLAPYTGTPDPAPLKLRALTRQTHDIKNFAGKVVLINFWASWCPPCVHEMPSMERLYQQLDHRHFEILGVNMAESPETIKGFLANKVKVSFPILLDSDGEVLKRWQVYAFPTSFLLDKNSKIRYALFGSIEWDTPEVMRKIRSLLDE